jgi:hypothetical protein
MPWELTFLLIEKIKNMRERIWYMLLLPHYTTINVSIFS